MDELIRPGRAPLSGKKEGKSAGQPLSKALSAAGQSVNKTVTGVREGLNKAVTNTRNGVNKAVTTVRESVDRAVTNTRQACVKTASAVKAGVLGIPAAASALGEKTVKVLRGMGAGIASAVGRHPVSPLLYLTIIALFFGVNGFQSTYIRAYAVSVDGVEVGVVADTSKVEAAKVDVENRVASIMGHSYDLDVEVTYVPVYSTQRELTPTEDIAECFYDTAEPDIDAFYEAYYASIMQACVLSVDGKEMGLAASREDMEAMLARAAEPFITSATVEYGFTPEVELSARQVSIDSTFDLEPIYEALTAPVVEESVYVVQKGDTFSRIAKNLEMTVNELAELNPEVVIDKIWVGDKLVVQRSVPYLSVWTVDNFTYEQRVESPIEYTETNTMYKGDTKVIEQGEDGLALVNANVKYVNGYETERTIVSSEDIKAPTVTKMLIGTKPRPKTASTGKYIWPVSGKITSRFGNRSSGYHTGLDIGVPNNTDVKAADGGTVTFAGWNKGGYGYLVVITHDNGNQTYYAHNNKVLVKVGDKVYQGQVIAKSGNTGNSTGPHCHFEIRIKGKAVNPLNYLAK